MGFNPWNIWGKMNNGAPRAGPGGVAGYNQSLLEATAEAMVSLGLRGAGYRYLNLDCGWTSGFRDEAGLQVNTTAFPSMTGLIDKVHRLGLKFGKQRPPFLPLSRSSLLIAGSVRRHVRRRAALAVLQPRPSRR